MLLLSIQGWANYEEIRKHSVIGNTVLKLGSLKLFRVFESLKVIQ